MTWTRAADVRAQVQRLWDRGEILASMVDGTALFPRRLNFKGPASSELSDRFDAVRTWIAELASLSHCRLETREIRHRVLGQNRVPSGIWIDTQDDALAWIGKRREVAHFRGILEQTRVCEPALLDWLARRPLRALELAGDWPRLLSIIHWLQIHPRPGIYLRQVDLAGVHTKLIESHRSTLAELLDLALPCDAIDARYAGVGRFALRYGFRDKPQRVRFRILDPERALLPTGGDQDIALDAASFARLAPQVSRVFVTENEVNFLAFPQVRDSLVLFGAGYGFEVLARAEWLACCSIHYWGDIDTHGFAILDQLRAHWPDAASFLMDRDTLLQFRTQWVEEETPASRDLARLTPEELALYDDLRDNRLGERVRLEQERIGFGWVESALAALG